MQIFRNKNLIIALVAALVVSVSAYFFYPSFAYAADLTSLPASVDVDVTYDQDSFTFTIGDVSHSFSRSYVPSYTLSDGTVCYPYDAYYASSSAGYVFFSSNDGYVSLISSSPVPDVEHNNNGISVDCSYWYSPSLNKLFIYRAPILSYGDYDGISCIVFSSVPEKDFTGDYSSSMYYRLNCYVYDFNDDSLSFWMNLPTGTVNDHTFINAYYSFPDDISFSQNSFYTCLNRFGNVYTAKTSTEKFYQLIPSDLLCVFANYNIPGYFSISEENIITPDYYFQYQYLFYTDKVGYIFIDSSDRLSSIQRSSDAVLMFVAPCNKHVWVLPEGKDFTQWNEITSVGYMYGSQFSMTYTYFFTGSTQADSEYVSKLIYSNDENYEKEPDFKPSDFPDPTDISGNLKNITDDYNVLQFINNKQQDGYCIEYPGSGMSYESFMVYLFSTDYVYMRTYSNPVATIGEFGKRSDSIHVFYPVSNVSSTSFDCVVSGYSVSPFNHVKNFISVLRGDDSSEYEADVVYTYFCDESDPGVKIPTFIAYLRLLNDSVGNIDTTLQSFMSDNYKQLKSIHENITALGETLSSVLNAINSLSIPSAFDDTDILNAIWNIKFPSYDDKKVIAAINGINLDNSKVVEAINSLSIPSAFDDTDILNAIWNIKFPSYDDKKVIDAINGIKYDDKKVIAAINGINLDNSKVVEAINSLSIPSPFDDTAIIEAINGISINVSGSVSDPGLIGDLCDVFDDDGIDSNGLYTFVSDTLEDVSKSIHFSEFVTFSDDLMGGIKFTNKLVGSVYTNLGDLKPVILCGAGFTLVAIVLRKERAT